jgi:exodeoxyribonuclease VII large subunit
MREAGTGDLFIAFETLKKKLEGEGLFDPTRKRPLPPRPRTIGIVTSPTGAAIQDMIRIATRRDPLISIILYPSKVQGEGAAADIARGIDVLNRYPGIDLIVIGRGGGSLEDLWAFNEEAVARAVAASRLPVISAVGHETDFTISDFTADLRAPTPSAAMELSIPLLRDGIMALDELTNRMERTIQRSLNTWETTLTRLLAAPGFTRPDKRLDQLAQRLDHFDQRLNTVMQTKFQVLSITYQSLMQQIEGLNPRQILNRGYAYVQRADDRKPVVSVKESLPGLKVSINFHDGTAFAHIDE